MALSNTRRQGLDTEGPPLRVRRPAQDRVVQPIDDDPLGFRRLLDEVSQHAPLQATKKYLDRFPQIKDENRRTFAAMMSAMDDAVGRVMAKVREMGQEENTLVWFFSDNGGQTQQRTR